MYLNVFGASRRRGRCKGSLTRLRNKYNKEHEGNMSQLKDQHKSEVESINKSYDTQISQLKDQHQSEIKNIKNENETMMKQLIEKYTSDHQNEINALNASYQEQISKLKEDQVSEINALNVSYQQQISQLKEEHDLQIKKLIDYNRGLVEHVIAENKAEHKKELDTVISMYDNHVKSIKDKYQAEEAKMLNDLGTLELQLEQYVKGKEAELKQCDDEKEQLKEELKKIRTPKPPTERRIGTVRPLRDMSKPFLERVQDDIDRRKIIENRRKSFDL
jgi:hypothetical protein